jgi:hypothetical protein
MLLHTQKTRVACPASMEQSGQPLEGIADEQTLSSEVFSEFRAFFSVCIDRHSDLAFISQSKDFSQMPVKHFT